MIKRVIIYVRVSTDEQAEHGYSLPSQLEACRLYAERQGLTVVAEKTDDYSGAKLDRPGLDKVREMLKRREAEAVLVFSPDRLTRNLAHSLILREEWRKAGIELHYCNRGKSEDTAESRMTENIEAVFGDYWREKIIESSKRGRHTKASNGKWPCDGHAAYGYRKQGTRREARLVIHEAEAAIVRRIFTLFAGPDGMPLPLATIATILTAEGVLPPNRGGAMAKPGRGWYKGTLRNIVTRRAYAYGEFSYGGHTIHMPDLAIVDAELFELAQKRLKDSRARAVFGRKYDYLLVGHIQCSCELNMSGTPAGNSPYKKYYYYVCNAKLNSRHLRTCHEGMLRIDAADPIVWEWLTGLLRDPEKLDKGLRELSERQETELEPKYERMQVIVDLLEVSERKIKRLAVAFKDEEDDVVAEALRAELKAAGREREALTAELDSLRAELVSGKMSDIERDAVKTLAKEVTHKLANPTYAQKRALLNLLDVRVQLEWRNSVRGLYVTCSLKIQPTLNTNEPPNPSPTPIPGSSKNSNGQWLRIPAVRGSSYSTTMM